MIKLLKIDGNRGYFFSVPQGTNRVVIGKQGDELRLKWTNLEALTEPYAELIETTPGNWELKTLNPPNGIYIRGDLLQRNTIIALANMRNLEGSGDLVEIRDQLTFKLVEEPDSPQPISPEPAQ